MSSEMAEALSLPHVDSESLSLSTVTSERGSTGHLTDFRVKALMCMPHTPKDLKYSQVTLSCGFCGFHVAIWLWPSAGKYEHICQLSLELRILGNNSWDLQEGSQNVTHGHVSKKDFGRGKNVPLVDVGNHIFVQSQESFAIWGLLPPDLQPSSLGHYLSPTISGCDFMAISFQRHNVILGYLDRNYGNIYFPIHSYMFLRVSLCCPG